MRRRLFSQRPWPNAKFCSNLALPRTNLCYRHCLCFGSVQRRRLGELPYFLLAVNRVRHVKLSSLYGLLTPALHTNTIQQHIRSGTSSERLIAAPTMARVPTTLSSAILDVALLALQWAVLLGSLVNAEPESDVQCDVANSTWVGPVVNFLPRTHLPLLWQTFNSKGQNPCLVAAYAESQCTGEGETRLVNPLATHR